MTERQAAVRSSVEIVVISAILGAAGFLWPSDWYLQFLQLATMAIFCVSFLRQRIVRRPFPLAIRVIAPLVVLLPAFRGGSYVHHVWLSFVWFFLLELSSSAIRQRWMQEVRHRYAIGKLENQKAEWEST